MSAATILFMDMVGFSRKPTAEQRRLVNALNAEVIHELRPLLNPPMDRPGVLALPTGDGMALAFLHKADRSWDRSTIFHLVVRLHRWAHFKRKNHEEVQLRVGMHVGAVELVTDINGKANVCGDSINFTQRVMDAAGPRQTLLSEAAFREYVGAESPTSLSAPFSDELKAEFQGPIEVFARHGLHIPVYKLTLLPPQEWCSNEDPLARHLMVVNLIPPPREIVGTFGKRLQHATHVAIIQLTGERLLANLSSAEVNLSENLRRFWVFMPAPETCRLLQIPTMSRRAEPASPDLVKGFIDKWKELFTDVKKHHGLADLKLGVFEAPLYFGGSYLDWERPGGRIHVSPWIWGFATPYSPGFELEWVGSRPSTVYEVYVEGLHYLHSHTTNEIS
jgi:class 3 adenylate cyclase